jgi:hypothetical protein
MGRSSGSYEPSTASVLFALFFFGQWSELNVALIAVVAILGVLTLAVPYYSFRKILDETHEAMSGLLARKVEPRLRGGRLEIDHLSEFATVNAAITADPPPVMTRRSAIASPGFVPPSPL